MFLFFPESKKKTLEEMDEVFAQSMWAFKIKYQHSRLEDDVEVVKKDVNAAAVDIEQDIEGFDVAAKSDGRV